MVLPVERASAQTNALISKLRDDFSGRSALVVGFSGYDPFVRANGEVKGAALQPFFEELGQAVNLPLRYRKTNWSEFSELMKDHQIDTMLEPIIPTRNRTSYGVIPYMEIVCCVLVVPEKIARLVSKQVDEIRMLTAQYAERSIGWDRYLWTAQKTLFRIASGNKIGVTAGVLEQDILEEIGADSESFPPEDIEKNIVDWIKNGKCFLADNNSALAAGKTLDTMGKRVRIIHLFQDNLGAKCGFAVNIIANEGLADYLAHKCRFDLQHIREMLLSETPQGTFDGTRFRLLAPGDVPELPMANTNLTLIVHAENESLVPSSAKSLRGPIATPQPREDLKANHSHAHVSVNIQDFNTPLSLDEVLAITRDWDATNMRRVELIDKKITKQISAQENAELDRLQKLAGAKRQLVMPLPIKELVEIEATLRKKKQWPGQ